VDGIGTRLEDLGGIIDRHVIAKLGDVVIWAGNATSAIEATATAWKVDGPKHSSPMGGPGGTGTLGGPGSMERTDAIRRSYGVGTYGDFPDFRSGTPVMLHGREAIVPERDKVSTARRWLNDAGQGVVVNLYVAVDKAGTARAVSEEEYILQVAQKGLNEARLRVPVRAVAQRVG
jgi:hypothetical protein